MVPAYPYLFLMERGVQLVPGLVGWQCAWQSCTQGVVDGSLRCSSLAQLFVVSFATAFLNPQKSGPLLTNALDVVTWHILLDETKINLVVKHFKLPSSWWNLFWNDSTHVIELFDEIWTILVLNDTGAITINVYNTNVDFLTPGIRPHQSGLTLLNMYWIANLTAPVFLLVV